MKYSSFIASQFIIIIGIVTLWRCDIIIDCGIMASDILALRHLDISTIDTIVVTIDIIVTLYTVWPSCAMAFELWSASRALTLSRWFNSKGARQMSQWNTGPVCAASTCLVRLDFRVNAESQESHLCGLSVEWVFRWPVSVFLF